MVARRRDGRSGSFVEAYLCFFWWAVALLSESTVPQSLRKSKVNDTDHRSFVNTGGILEPPCSPITENQKGTQQVVFVARLVVLILISMGLGLIF
jgi:hypothetical protein